MCDDSRGVRQYKPRLDDDDDGRQCRGLGSNVLEKQKCGAGVLFFLPLLRYSLRSSSFDRLLYIRMRLTWPSTVPTMKTTRSLHLTTLPQSFGKNQSTSPSCHAIRGMRVRTTPSFTVFVGVHYTRNTLIFLCHRLNDFATS